MTSRAFPYHRTFPCCRFEKRDSPCPRPLLLSLYWTFRTPLRPRRWSKARNRIPSCSPTTGASIIPKVTNMGSNSHLLLSSLQHPFDSHWGGREGRAVKKGLPMIIARYMKQCSFLDLWAITHWWGTWVSGLISSGSQSKTKTNSIRKKEINCQCQGRLIPDCWNEFTRVRSVPLQSFWTRQLSKSYCWQTYWSTHWYFD